MALSGGSQGGKFTSAFGGAAEVHGRTASAGTVENDPKVTRIEISHCSEPLTELCQSAMLGTSG
jgi:hypothetical protein